MRIGLVSQVILMLCLACSDAGPPDVPGATPDDAFETYRALLKSRSLTSESLILTATSRELLGGGYGGRQRANEASAIAGAGDAVTEQRGGRAVVWFPDRESASPYFLQLGSEGWQIDLSTMATQIVFDSEGRWRFRSQHHAYMFAFR